LRPLISEVLGAGLSGGRSGSSFLQKKLDFLAIQETKMEACSDSFCHGLWGNDGCDWVALPAVGNSGGILSLWNKVVASRVFHFSGE
jgi:hypothetical protein